MDIKERIEELVTLERAREYNAETDKFIWALDLMRHELDMVLPLSSDRTEELVEYFEIQLDAILVASA